LGRKTKERPVIGWREWASLPGLGIDRIKAKIDTGARSSALHAFGIERFERRGRPWVRFRVHPYQRSRYPSVVAEAPVLDYRKVRNPGGRLEMRPTIRTALQVMGEEWDIELTLTPRWGMGFRILLGRQAVRRRFVVDSGRSFVGGAFIEPRGDRKLMMRRKKKRKKKKERQASPSNAARSS